MRIPWEGWGKLTGLMTSSAADKDRLPSTEDSLHGTRQAYRGTFLKDAHHINTVNQSTRSQ